MFSLETWVDYNCWLANGSLWDKVIETMLFPLVPFGTFLLLCFPCAGVCCFVSAVLTAMCIRALGWVRTLACWSAPLLLCCAGPCLARDAFGFLDRALYEQRHMLCRCTMFMF